MTAPAPTYVDDRLAHWAEQLPDGVAFTYAPTDMRARSWTWREWEDRVRRCAGGLRALGVGRGDVVGFLDKNHPACVELSLAAASLGAANAIVNWRSAGDEVDYAVNDSGARCWWWAPSLMPTSTRSVRASPRREGHRGHPDGAEATSTKRSSSPRSGSPVGRRHPTTSAW
jgi:acyl-CoA synthetase (AMP-forming)/AMP-acid ligase II